MTCPRFKINFISPNYHWWLNPLVTNFPHLSPMNWSCLVVWYKVNCSYVISNRWNLGSCNLLFWRHIVSMCMVVMTQFVSLRLSLTSRVTALWICIYSPIPLGLCSLWKRLPDLSVIFPYRLLFLIRSLLCPFPFSFLHHDFLVS